jgi:hypothetical protein
MLEPEAQQIADAWHQASRELGIEFVSPFFLESAEGRSFQYLGLLPQFGSPKGMLLLEDVDWERTRTAQVNGYGYSCLMLHSYGKYDRDLFIDTLNDWGWSESQGPPPTWYNGPK